MTVEVREADEGAGRASCSFVASRRSRNLRPRKFLQLSRICQDKEEPHPSLRGAVGVSGLCLAPRWSLKMCEGWGVPGWWPLRLLESRVTGRPFLLFPVANCWLSFVHDQELW